MDVALATAAVTKPLPFMTPRSTPAGEEGADPRIRPDGKDAAKDSIVGRYTSTAFTYNADASRLILLFRDPATGITLDQIPSEVALRQYEEAQRKEKRQQSAGIDVVIGGAEDAAGSASTAASGRDGGGSSGMRSGSAYTATTPGTGSTGTGLPTRERTASTGMGTTGTASLGGSFMPSGAAASGATHVNMVI